MTLALEEEGRNESHFRFHLHCCVNDSKEEMALYDSKEETVQYEDPTRTVRVDMLSAFFEVCYKIFQNLLLRKAAGMCLEKLSHSRVPKPQKLHVNLDHGGLGDFGNCCLSVPRRNSLAVMALL